MRNARYATVDQFITVGNYIVQAVEVDQPGVALTGLLVDMPSSGWANLDALEAGYKRIRVKTSRGDEAYMYASPTSTREDFSRWEEAFKRGKV